MLPHGMVLWFVEKPVVPVVGDAEGTDVDGAIVVPMADALDPTIPKGEDEMVGDGTVISGLTPTFPISNDPNGIPARVAPPGDAEGAGPLGDAGPAEPPAQGAVPAPIPPPAASPPPS
jgi:hypothetical protein